MFQSKITIDYIVFADESDRRGVASAADLFLERKQMPGREANERATVYIIQMSQLFFISYVSLTIDIQIIDEKILI